VKFSNRENGGLRLSADDGYPIADHRILFGITKIDTVVRLHVLLFESEFAARPALSYPPFNFFSCVEPPPHEPISDGAIGRSATACSASKSIYHLIDVPDNKVSCFSYGYKAYGLSPGENRFFKLVMNPFFGVRSGAILSLIVSMESFGR